MKILRVLAVLSGIALIAVLTGAVRTFFWPGVGHMERYASAQLNSQCGFQSACVIQLRDLFEGDWDTLYEFGASVPQNEIESTLGSGEVVRHGASRIFVCTRNGRVVTSEQEPTTLEPPFKGELEFVDEHHREERAVRLTADTWMRVHPFTTKENDTYYVLSVKQ